METYKQLLAAQKEALEKDIEKLIEYVQEIELDLEEAKRQKSEAQSILRGIEKKLAKP